MMLQLKHQTARLLEMINKNTCIIRIHKSTHTCNFRYLSCFLPGNLAQISSSEHINKLKLRSWNVYKMITWQNAGEENSSRLF